MTMLPMRRLERRMSLKAMTAGVKSGETFRYRHYSLCFSGKIQRKCGG
jgi:hypothetical protein